MDTHLLTVNEAAEYVRVHPATVRRWIHGGQLPAAKVGAGFRIAAEDLSQLTKPKQQPSRVKKRNLPATMERVRKMLEDDPRKTSTEEIEAIIKDARRGREDVLLKHCR